MGSKLACELYEMILKELFYRPLCPGDVLDLSWGGKEDLKWITPALSLPGTILRQVRVSCVPSGCPLIGMCYLEDRTFLKGSAYNLHTDR